MKSTGFVSMIRPDGTQLPSAGSGYNGDGAVSIPWGINVDGNDDVWTTNGWTRGIVYMAGDNTKGHPAGTKTGDVLHRVHQRRLRELHGRIHRRRGQCLVCQQLE